MKSFDPSVHTLEYMEREWGVTSKTLLYKRMIEVGLTGVQLIHALWAAKETCINCADTDCQCWDEPVGM